MKKQLEAYLRTERLQMHKRSAYVRIRQVTLLPDEIKIIVVSKEWTVKPAQISRSATGIEPSWMGLSTIDDVGW